MNLLTSLLNGIVRLISFLTGKSISGMKSAAQGINSVGSAAGSTAKKTKDAGKEAKKAAGELAAFDELNVLNKQQEEDTDDDTGGGGGGAGSGLAYDFEQAQNPLKDLMGRLSNFWDAFLARLAPSVAAWKAAWEQIRQAAMDVWARHPGCCTKPVGQRPETAAFVPAGHFYPRYYQRVQPDSGPCCGGCCFEPDPHGRSCL